MSGNIYALLRHRFPFMCLYLKTYFLAKCQIVSKSFYNLHYKKPPSCPKKQWWRWDGNGLSLSIASAQHRNADDLWNAIEGTHIRGEQIPIEDPLLCFPSHLIDKESCSKVQATCVACTQAYKLCCQDYDIIVIGLHSKWKHDHFFAPKSFIFATMLTSQQGSVSSGLLEIAGASFFSNFLLETSTTCTLSINLSCFL